jgi:hypothetical protein
MPQTLPSSDEVARSVVLFVAGFTGIPVDDIDITWALRDQALSFDDNRLAFLAMSLRGYVQSFNSAETVRAADTRKAGQTVQGLIVICDARIRA